MDPTLFLPSEIAQWLMRYGLFLAVAAFLFLLLLVLLKPFWSWLSGSSEVNDRLKTLVDLQRKALTELEILNRTLTRPLKKKAEPAPTRPDSTTVNEERKKALLEALAQTQRKRLKDQDLNGEDAEEGT